MAITIGSVKATDCGIGISAASTSDLQVGSVETTRCNIGTHIRDDINTSLKDLLNKVEELELSNKDEERLRSDVTTLIKTQLKSPSAVKELVASFRNIFEGATGSLVYATYSTWAITHGLPVIMS